MLVREQIEMRLKRSGWSGSELARRLDEHRNWVNYRLSGRTEIKADDLPRIAEALGISPCDFFEGIDSQGEQVRPVITLGRFDSRGRPIPPSELDSANPPKQPTPEERRTEMLERYLMFEMELAPEHVRAVITLVTALPRTA